MKNVSILNLGFSNIKSVEGAFRALEIDVQVITRLDKADGVIVLPGVGTFSEAMAFLSENETEYHLLEMHKQGYPIVGICLGMQILFNDSQEAPGVRGLGLLPASVTQLQCSRNKLNITANIGYSSVYNEQNVSMHHLKRANQQEFYFMHSYGVLRENFLVQNSLYSRFHDKEIISCFQFENLHGIQFHPERSGIAGLGFLKNIMKDL